jgi:hypothetical protein
MKWAYFVSQFTTTKITRYMLDRGNLSMKFIEMDDHDIYGVGKGCNNLDGLVFSYLSF